MEVKMEVKNIKEVKMEVKMDNTFVCNKAFVPFNSQFNFPFNSQFNSLLNTKSKWTIHLYATKHLSYLTSNLTSHLTPFLTV